MRIVQNQLEYPKLPNINFMIGISKTWTFQTKKIKKKNEGFIVLQ